MLQNLGNPKKSLTDNRGWMKFTFAFCVRVSVFCLCLFKLCQARSSHTLSLSSFSPPGTSTTGLEAPFLSQSPQELNLTQSLGKPQPLVLCPPCGLTAIIQKPHHTYHASYSANRKSVSIAELRATRHTEGRLGLRPELLLPL